MSASFPVDLNRVAALGALSRLDRWLRAHNRTALAAAGASLVLSILGWGLFYAGGYTVGILYGSISKSLDGFQLDRVNDFTQLKALYAPAFLAVASFLTGCAALLTHWHPARVWHEELSTLPRAVVDAVLFPAMMLVDGLDTLRALVRLRATDRPVAIALLAQLEACGGRLAMGQLSLDVPDRPQLLRILQRLHVAQVLQTRAGPDEPQICWSTREARQELAVRLPRPATESAEAAA
ncbi:MAG: hypothetical protein JSR82_05610 [Verrucomicrobia bacterium]|nr:hypothetical protein [Verrucomicrobiota bacterium]